MRSALARSSFDAMVAQVLSVFMSASLGVFLARLLGAQAYGDFVYCYTWLLILVIPAKLGMDTTVMKYLSAYTANSDFARMNGILRFAVRKTFFASLIVTAICGILVYALAANLSQSLTSTAIFTILCIAPLSILHVMQYGLYGMKRYFQAQLPESIIRPGILILGCSVTFLISQKASSPETMSYNLIITSIVSVGTYVYMRSTLPFDSQKHPPVYEAREWKAVGDSMLLISGMNFILSQTDIVLIGLLNGTYEAGLYAAAARVSALVLFFYTAINSVAAPLVAHAYSAKELHTVAKLAKTSLYYIMASTLLCGLIFLLNLETLLSLFGEEFKTSYACLAILIISQVFRALSGIGGFLLTMTAHENLAARLTFKTALLNLITASFLIPKWGAVGGAYATMLSTVVWSIGVIVSVKKSLQINCTI